MDESLRDGKVSVFKVEGIVSVWIAIGRLDVGVRSEDVSSDGFIGLEFVEVHILKEGLDSAGGHAFVSVFFSEE